MRYFILSFFSLMLAGCGLDETLDRSDKPLSREAASKNISVPFPPSSREIYYVFHSGGMQELQMFVRFTVDQKDLDSAVDGILLDHDKQAKEHYSYPLLPIASAPRSPVFPHLQPMSWWRPDSITNGYYRGTTNGQPFYLWVSRGKQRRTVCEQTRTGVRAKANTACPAGLEEAGA